MSNAEYKISPNLIMFDSIEVISTLNNMSEVA